ncbi:MAG: metallophosphoesterase [Flavobacteriales bacterium]|nr:metallophosphoesterase [Flavobacteriales bacterium]
MDHPEQTTPQAKAHDENAVPIARRISKVASILPPLFRLSGKPERMPMVGWFDPGELFSTGLRSMISLVIGEQSDKRLMQALASRKQEYYDHSIHYLDRSHGPQPLKEKAREDIWLDYICDTGDGWNPTYAIAMAAAQRKLTVHGAHGAIDLPRGDVLVFGGDEVYPTPSREEYQRRLVVPYTKAFGDDQPEERPHVYAIPGNHDWYDGLSAFSRLFCSDIGGRRFAGWWTRQKRSYFVLKLPHGWWLLGSDGQLQSDMDVPQIEHFREIAERHMKFGDKVILCLSLPVWVYAQKYRAMGRTFDETDLIHLREEVFAKRGIEVKVFLTGDLHHYRRHEETKESAGEAQPVQKITAGGGGAFLHPTHEEDVSLLVEEPSTPEAKARNYAVKATYPDMKRSARIAYGNLLFLLKNPRFGIVPALLYLITAWLVGASVGAEVPRSLWRAMRITADVLGDNPGLALWMLSILAAFLAFTDTHSKVYRVLGGLAHWVVHIAAMFYIGWGALSLSHMLFGELVFFRSALTGFLIFSGGWIAGSIIMGIYLLVSINVFGRHSEEAFSGLKHQDHKHFLRLNIDRQGTLTIWPIKIERVPRSWRERKAGEPTNALVVPAAPLKAELIEAPIVVR